MGKMINWKKRFSKCCRRRTRIRSSSCGGSNTEETATSSAAGAGDDGTFHMPSAGTHRPPTRSTPVIAGA